MIKWHYRMALIAALAVLIWGCSGLLHPLMTWTNPRAVTFMPPAAQGFIITASSLVLKILEENEIEGFSELRVGPSWVQIRLTGENERLYFAIPSGQRIADADRDHAVMLARHYTGLQDTPVIGATLISEFGNRYTYINRYLPVWKISFDDPRKITVYIDTATDRLGAITDTRKVILQTLFQVLHTGQWLDGVEPLRVALIALLVGVALSVALAGLYMLVALRGKRKGLRRIHRVLAYAALLPLLMFPVSGVVHLFVQSPLFYPDQADEHNAMNIHDLDYWPQGRAEDMRAVGAAWWRVQDGRQVAYKNMQDGHSLVGDEAFVRQMVTGEIKDVSLVTSFNDEYGFAYKRLPVWRVDAEGSLTFIEARTGVVAAKVDKLKVAETWLFSRLHKWQFLDGISERVSGPGPFRTAFRDAVMVAFILLGLAMAVIGWQMRRK